MTFDLPYDEDYDAARSTWSGLRPALGATGKILVASPPNERGNFFYRLWYDEDDYDPSDDIRDSIKDLAQEERENE